MTSPPGRIDSRLLIDTVLEEGSFVSWDVDEPVADPDSPYGVELTIARARTGLGESVVTGSGRVGGHPVAVIVGEFSFLGGSIGVAAARRIIAAVERATVEGLPILAAPVSGGTRMQEGTVAFVQMIAISQAVAAHKAAGLPYLVYLRHPTTGGVFASWGSMGHVTVAQPGALIGFLGPRVFEALHGHAFPDGVQTAENLYRLGLVDAVVEHEHLGSLITSVLEILSSVAASGAGSVLGSTTPQPTDAEAIDVWESIRLSRLSARPGLRSVLRATGARSVLLNGAASGAGYTHGDRALIVALARFSGRSAVVIGHDRRAQGDEVAIGPGALRAARRGVRLAEDLGLPIVTVIDTPGAALSREAEEGGLAGEIAQCLVALSAARVPIVSVILGQGAGGGALALLPADRVLVSRHGWLAPLPPEGASAIVHRSPDFADVLAREQRVAADCLVADGIADDIIPEHPSADREPEAFAGRVVGMIAASLEDFDNTPTTDRPEARRLRFLRTSASQLADRFADRTDVTDFTKEPR